MKKKLLNLIFLIGIILLPSINVYAATGKIDIYTSSKTVTVGNTVTISVYCESTTTIGTCEYTLDYDKNKLKLTTVHDQSSCNQDAYCMYSVGSKKSTAKKFTFKVLTSGTHKVSAKAVTMYELNTKEEDTLIQTSVDYTTFQATSTTSSSNTTKPSSTTPTYSTNNYLKSLSIDNLTLSPKFDKNTTTYNVTATSEIKEINIKAQTEDTKSKITGTGKYPVSLGNNVFKVVVTSEKGTTKTYTINITIEDKNPIIISIDNTSYTIIKTKNVLTKPNNYTDTTVNINNEEIPAFYNELLDYTLIGLKDESGDIYYAIYTQPNTYRLYKEHQFNSITLEIDETKEYPDLEKTTVLLGEDTITAYKKNNSSYVYFYGTNLETGESNWYSYDTKEQTVQRVENNTNNQDELDRLRKLNMVLIGTCIFLSLILILISLMKMNKNHKNTTDQKKHYEELREGKLNNKQEEIKETKKTKKEKKPEKMLDDW